MAYSLGIAGAGGSNKSVGMGDLRAVEQKQQQQSAPRIEFMSGINGSVIPGTRTYGPYPAATVSPTASYYMSGLQEGEVIPVGVSYGPSAVTQQRYPAQTVEAGLGVGSVPGMPEGYGYANGFPFRGTQPPGWNIGNANVPGWAMDSTGFNWADTSAYGSGKDKTKTETSPVKFSEQGKDKGITANSVLNKTMAQAALEQYGRGSQTYYPYWNALYNAYGGSMLPDTFNPLVQSTLDYYKLGIPNRSSSMLPDTYQNLALRWLQQNTTGRQLADTFKFQQGRLAEQLTALLGRQTPTTSGGGNGYPVRYRSYGGGGGSGYGYDYGGSSYSPSWSNGLINWRM